MVLPGIAIHMIRCVSGSPGSFFLLIIINNSKLRKYPFPWRCIPEMKLICKSHSNSGQLIRIVEFFPPPPPPAPHGNDGGVTLLVEAWDGGWQRGFSGDTNQRIAQSSIPRKTNPQRQRQQLKYLAADIDVENKARSGWDSTDTQWIQHSSC